MNFIEKVHFPMIGDRLLSAKDFTKVREIGRGGMGNVFVGMVCQSGTMTAIKDVRTTGFPIVDRFSDRLEYKRLAFNRNFFARERSRVAFSQGRDGPETEGRH
jgi:hypothetical protein